MEQTYPVSVTDGRGSTYHCRKTLANYGLFYAGDDCYSGIVPEKSISKLKSYCKSKKLHFQIKNEYGSRSADYRKVFFANNPPAFGNVYFCAYCGKPLWKQSITVDHLYPVAKAGKDLKAQKRLQRRGLTSINDPRNLVPACAPCNQRKSDKTGKWIIIGKIGRNQKLWIARWCFRLAIIAIVLGALIYYLPK